ncbi:ligase-associated DNA damage response DEXH box helicase [Ahrensia sp. R2A130]|uniref:ligase-associated DNA damage response DEXH box helicase n=1 Tax=Ahrensia sp. R2A130 TaxID=744979 RepID=UPI0001E0F08A|nr:ligase-associated DNA damage response DEXH box helicase [Ahrensia sp. R2A130]EFL89881.1 large ATP-dependent helicase-related protein [Ahrensia sp. R2A130]
MADHTATTTVEAVRSDVGEPLTAHLPDVFTDWFAERGWAPRTHQLELLAGSQAGRSSLLIAPTGAGKTLAGFLPALTDLAQRPKRKPGEAYRGIHTLYISPLKALAVDIKRNLEMPVDEMDLPIKIETRTGDTPSSRRQRQKLNPPDIMLTTPEQLALLIASDGAERFFDGLRYVIFDELHSLVTNKRGHLLSLGLARLRKLQPAVQTIGLSATVSEPLALQRWLVPQNRGDTRTDHAADLITVSGGAKPNITILDTSERLPWSGHSAKHAVGEILKMIEEHRTTLIFVNTRSQAEFLFQYLWHINDDNLPIALHHGSLEVGQRRKVEAAMSDNLLRAVIATSTLDLGIDWGDVDLVVHLGAPKGASRLAQRIGRSNHRMDEPSKAILVPANRFEVLECKAALDANYLGDQDTPPLRPGGLDVLCQHILGMAVAGPFQEDDLYAEVISAAPYAELDWDTFDRCIQYVATGGYALKAYERYAKIIRTSDGTWRLTHPRLAQQYRMNAGTIYELPAMNVRQVRQGRKNGQLPAGRGGRVLGKLDEYFLTKLVPGNTFMFSGQVCRFEGFRENEAIVTKTQHDKPMVPSYAGSKFPYSTMLASYVREMISDPKKWPGLPPQVSDWLHIQRRKSIIPEPDQVLVETFPRGEKFYLITYSFEGYLAHQTLAMLLTKRLERAGAKPTGYVATDYVVAIWGLEDMGAMIADGSLDLDDLYDEDMLGDDLEAWMNDSFMLKRTFRQCAMIALLIEKNAPQKSKTGRQMTQSSDLIYDVLREHEPDHILLQATREDAATGLLDVRRVGTLLARAQDHIVHKNLDKLSPMAVPIMLEAGRERVDGAASESLLVEAAENLIAEAMEI